MTSELQVQTINPLMRVFTSEEFGRLRTVVLNSEPYVCLVDVCKVLDIDNPRQVKVRLRPGGVINNDAPLQEPNKQAGTAYGAITVDTVTESGIQPMTYINEGNLYRVIFQSRKPVAEKFADWVFDEVLPAIRKQGAYIAPQATIGNLKEYRAQTARMREETAQIERYLKRLPKKEAEKVAVRFFVDKGMLDAPVPDIEDDTAEEPPTLAQLKAYLNTPLPPNWNELSIADRRKYLANPDGSGTVLRNDVCSFAVWCECYGREIAAMTKMDARAIAHELSELGWASHGAERKRFIPYGRQRIYYR